MKLKGAIDSLNFSSVNIEDYFKSNEDYIIQTIKGLGVFEPDVWRETFKRSLTQSIVEAKILHSSKGLAVPIKRFNRTPQRETVEFAGLRGYNERSLLLQELLKYLWEYIQDATITRIDICIDFDKKIPPRVLKMICRDRTPLKRWNTFYYKSSSEKKSNNYVNIKSYNKSKTKNDTENIHRLEFSFMSSYIGKLQVKNIEALLRKTEKSIKRFSGLNVKTSVL